jgi:hypothetical protein
VEQANKDLESFQKALTAAVKVNFTFTSNSTFKAPESMVLFLFVTKTRKICGFA